MTLQDREGLAKLGLATDKEVNIIEIAAQLIFQLYRRCFNYLYGLSWSIEINSPQSWLKTHFFRYSFSHIFEGR